MDALQQSYLARARTAIDMASDPEATNTTGRARDFLHAVRCVGLHGSDLGLGTFGNALERHATTRAGRVLSEQAKAQAFTTADEAWSSAPGRELARSFIASYREGSILDQVARFAANIPLSVHGRVMFATGWGADIINEAHPKVIQSAGFDPLTANRRKAAGIVVTTQEVLRATGDDGLAMLERELATATLAACNHEALDQLEIAGTVTDVTATATNIREILAEGIAAAPSASAYVVGMRPALVAALALESDGRMGPQGGDFAPNISIVPSEISSGSTSTPKAVVIPASKCSIRDEGLMVRITDAAAVSMVNADQPAQLVSLFQTGSVGLLVEREFRITTAAKVVHLY